MSKSINIYPNPSVHLFLSRNLRVYAAFCLFNEDHQKYYPSNRLIVSEVVVRNKLCWKKCIICVDLFTDFYLKSFPLKKYVFVFLLSSKTFPNYSEQLTIFLWHCTMSDMVNENSETDSRLRLIKVLRTSLKSII